jgi:hypothetical protein
MSLTSRQKVHVTPWEVWRIAYCAVPSNKCMYKKTKEIYKLHVPTTKSLRRKIN